MAGFRELPMDCAAVLTLMAGDEPVTFHQCERTRERGLVHRQDVDQIVRARARILLERRQEREVRDREVCCGQCRVVLLRDNPSRSTQGCAITLKRNSHAGTVCMYMHLVKDAGAGAVCARRPRECAFDDRALSPDGGPSVRREPWW